MIASHKRLACWLTSWIPWWGTNLERLAPGSKAQVEEFQQVLNLNPLSGGEMFVDLIVSSCSSDLPFVVWCLMIENVVIYLDLRNLTSSHSQFWFGDLVSYLLSKLDLERVDCHECQEFTPLFSTILGIFVLSGLQPGLHPCWKWRYFQDFTRDVVLQQWFSSSNRPVQQWRDFAATMPHADLHQATCGYFLALGLLYHLNYLFSDSLVWRLTKTIKHPHFSWLMQVFSTTKNI